MPGVLSRPSEIAVARCAGAGQLLDAGHGRAPGGDPAAVRVAVRADPGAARQLLVMFTAFSSQSAYFRRMREELIGAGVAGQFLPGYEEIHPPFRDSA